jgi:hypothetical protein
MHRKIVLEHKELSSPFLHLRIVSYRIQDSIIIQRHRKIKEKNFMLTSITAPGSFSRSFETVFDAA